MGEVMLQISAVVFCFCLFTDMGLTVMVLDYW